VNDLNGELKANTVLAYYSTLRAVFNFAASDLDMPVTFPGLKPSELPDPADDAGEHRVLTDDELAAVIAEIGPEKTLFFRTLAETGCRASEALGLIPRRIGDGTIQFAPQLGKDGTLRPLESRQSKRTIEVRGALTAELRLAAGERVFDRLALWTVERAWKDALDQANLNDPQPVVHDLRHTHASKLIAAGWDPVEVAQPARRPRRNHPEGLRARVRWNMRRPSSGSTGTRLRTKSSPAGSAGQGSIPNTGS
jgi:integrase